MLAWVHQALAGEQEFVAALLGGGQQTPQAQHSGALPLQLCVVLLLI